MKHHHKISISKFQTFFIHLIITLTIISVTSASTQDTGGVNVPTTKTTKLQVTSTPKPKSSQAVIPDIVKINTSQKNTDKSEENDDESSASTIRSVTVVNYKTKNEFGNLNLPSTRPAWKNINFKIEKDANDEDRRVNFVDNILTAAVEAGDTDGVKRILDQKFGSLTPEKKLTEGADFVNYWDAYPLRKASELGHTKIVEMLIDHGAIVTAMNSEAIRLAAQNGHLKIVKKLFKEGAEYQVFQDYSIRAAAMFNHTDVVDFLLSIGGDPKSYKKFGNVVFIKIKKNFIC